MLTWVFRPEDLGADGQLLAMQLLGLRVPPLGIDAIGEVVHGDQGIW
jgi:hypothetical protein